VKDEEVAHASTAIFMAGYQAQLIAAEMCYSLKPNRKCADPDYALSAQVLTIAGLSKKQIERKRLPTSFFATTGIRSRRSPRPLSQRESLTFDELSVSSRRDVSERCYVVVKANVAWRLKCYNNLLAWLLAHLAFCSSACGRTENGSVTKIPLMPERTPKNFSETFDERFQVAPFSG
jgi:hypothetical protein